MFRNSGTSDFEELLDGCPGVWPSFANRRDKGASWLLPHCFSQTSTRLFCSRPSSVSLGAIGNAFP